MSQQTNKIPLAEQYLAKIKEVCVHVSGNLLEMPAAIQAIHALVNEFEETKLK